MCDGFRRCAQYFSIAKNTEQDKRIFKQRLKISIARFDAHGPSIDFATVNLDCYWVKRFLVVARAHFGRICRDFCVSKAANKQIVRAQGSHWLSKAIFIDRLEQYFLMCIVRFDQPREIRRFFHLNNRFSLVHFMYRKVLSAITTSYFRQLLHKHSKHCLFSSRY